MEKQPFGTDRRNLWPPSASAAPRRVTARAVSSAVSERLARTYPVMSNTGAQKKPRHGGVLSWRGVTQPLQMTYRQVQCLAVPSHRRGSGFVWNVKTPSARKTIMSKAALGLIRCQRPKIMNSIATIPMGDSL